MTHGIINLPLDVGGENAGNGTAGDAPPAPDWPEGTILVMVDGIIRPATAEELADIEERQQPAPQVKVPSIPPTQFAKLLGSVLGLELAAGLLQQPAIFLAYAGAGKIDYDDIFVCVDGDPSVPGYALQMAAAGAVTPEQVAALESAWPTTD